MRRSAAEGFAASWMRRDPAAMWLMLDKRSRAAYPRARFARSYVSADSEATLTERAHRPRHEHRGGRFALPVAMPTRIFGTLRGTIAAARPRRGRRGADRLGAAPAPAGPARRRAGHARDARAPDPRRGARRRRPAAGRQPGDGGASPGARRRAAIAAPASSASTTSAWPAGPARSCASATASSPRSSAAAGARSTRRSGPGCSAPPPPRWAASSAAWPWCARATARCSPWPASPSRRPSRRARRSRSSPCPARWPPGVATPSSSYPVRTSATLSGVKLRNAGGESCGGSLTQAFIDSCNSVFAPLGAKLGAKRLVRMAEAFGFNEQPARARRQAEHDPAGRQAHRQPRGRRQRHRPGPRPRHAAADGRSWGRRSPSADAAPGRASCATTRSCAGAWSARAWPARCAR